MNACAAHMACQRTGARALHIALWRARPGPRARTPASQSSARAHALPAHSAASARQAAWPAPSRSACGRAGRLAPSPGGRAASVQAAPPATGCRDCMPEPCFAHACVCRLGRLGAKLPPAPPVPSPIAALLGRANSRTCTVRHVMRCAPSRARARTAAATAPASRSAVAAAGVADAASMWASAGLAPPPAAAATAAAGPPHAT